MERMSNENLIQGFGEVEKDAIGEIENITMGSAATAVSNLLGAKVWITTPQVSVVKAKDMSYPDLEPSIHVTIQYIKGVSGSSILVLKQNDVQLILNQLMGQPLVISDDFQFDEMNISAVCEVMNQMMGASATALSELIDTSVDISTPVAAIHEKDEPFSIAGDVDGEDYVCQVKFNITIDGVINSEFITVLSIDLAKSMADKMLQGYGTAVEEATKENSFAQEAAAIASQSGDGKLSQEQIEAMLNVGNASSASSSPAPSPAAPAPASQPAPQPVPQPAPAQNVPDMQNPQAAMPQMNMQQMPQQPYGYPQQPADPNMQQMPQGYPPYYYQQPVYMQPNVNVQPVQLKSFEDYNSPLLNKDENDNLKLLMGIPLDVTVELGSTSKKVKEILEFQQGTIIELERQAGAPVDVIVNGHLIAKGDVVVIGDNFAVRITEIVKSRFLESLGEANK